MSVFNTPRTLEHSLVHDVVSYASTHLSEDLSTAALSARAGVSERHLDRLFVQELDTSPGRFVRRIRTEAAAHLLTGSDPSPPSTASGRSRPSALPSPRRTA